MHFDGAPSNHAPHHADDDKDTIRAHTPIQSIRSRRRHTPHGCEFVHVTVPCIHLCSSLVWSGRFVTPHLRVEHSTGTCPKRLHAVLCPDADYILKRQQPPTTTTQTGNSSSSSRTILDVASPSPTDSRPADHIMIISFWKPHNILFHCVRIEHAHTHVRSVVASMCLWRVSENRVCFVELLRASVWVGSFCHARQTAYIMQSVLALDHQHGIERVSVCVCSGRMSLNTLYKTRAQYEAFQHASRQHVYGPEPGKACRARLAWRNGQSFTCARPLPPTQMPVVISGGADNATRLRYERLSSYCRQSH